MKTVKSVEDLKALALRKGASVKLEGGQRFNEARERGDPPPVRRTAAPAPVPAPQITNVVKVDLERLEKALVETIRDLPSQKPLTFPDPPAPWASIRFRVTERDAAGNIREFVAERIK